MAQIEFQILRFANMTMGERVAYLDAIENEMGIGDTLRLGNTVFDDFNTFMNTFDQFDDLNLIIDFFGTR